MKDSPSIVLVCWECFTWFTQPKNEPFSCPTVGCDPHPGNIHIAKEGSLTSDHRLVIPTLYKKEEDCDD